ncbi:MAG: hypothetical protein E7261_10245 [Lachnospiraceae bacterium]|nr:hypothetical protein [Lachnospiraceae bacterium]
MMKLHVCPECKYRVLTSRRLECECKNCQVSMLKVDTVGFEEWWQMSEDERDVAIEQFLDNIKLRISI